MNWKNFLLASLAGGAGMALLSNLPLLSLGNCLLCFWVWGGGILAAWVYKRLQGTVTVSDGGWLGALAGFLGGLISALLTFSGATGIGLVPGTVSGLLPAALQSQVDILATMQDMVVTFALMEVFAFTFFGAVGGLIGGVLFREKGEPQDERPGEPGYAVRSLFPSNSIAPAVSPSSVESPSTPDDLQPHIPPERTFIPPPQPRPLEGRGEHLHEDAEPPGDYVS